MRIRPYLRYAGRFGLLPLICLSLRAAHAGSATWDLNATSTDWNTAVNWTPDTVPNAPTDVATFGVSNTTDISLSAAIQVSSIVFNPGASAFNITVASSGFSIALTIKGGVVNNSGITQNFTTTPESPHGEIRFFNTATAGSLTMFTNNGGAETGGGGGEFFHDASSADQGIFVNNGGMTGASGGGGVIFFDNATAGNASFTNNGGRSNSFGGGVAFFNNSTAENATIISNGSAFQGGFGGNVQFADQATAGNALFIFNGTNRDGAAGGHCTFLDEGDAGNATFIANGGRVAGGQIHFDSGNGNGGTARFELFGNGSLDISRRDGGVTIGSLEGDGLAFLGEQNLSVGSAVRNTTFSGLIQDGGAGGGIGGMLTKIGTSKLTLTNPNTYTGGTVIDGGTLLVNNTTGSGLGPGAVQVTTGTLGGSGIISGNVSLGIGNGPGAVLGPGQNSVTPGTLTIRKGAILKADATYRVTLNSSIPSADRLVAKGVRISGAQIVFSDGGSGILPPGTIFTLISNTSANPINGAFNNLADGAIVNVNGNNLQANYEGGDGNDLTLTVVP